jgi:phage head maturation protease
MGTEFLIIEAAADNGNSKVVGLAYSGGKMKLPGWKYPVVVDLAGMQIPEQVPLLANHENKVASRVGMVAAKVVNNTLEIEGDIVAKGEQADDIVAQAKAGADWQLSIGADVSESELVKGKRTVNGQEHSGPFYHVKAAVLREVSVVAVGADADTKLKVTASFDLGKEPEDQAENTPEKQSKEKEEKSVKDVPKKAPEDKEKEKNKEPQKTASSGADIALQAIREERERVGKIQAICAGEYADIERQAISAGWTPEETSEKVLKALRENRPAADVNIIVKRKPAGDRLRKNLEAAMCLRVGVHAEDLVASYGEEVVEAGSNDMDMPVKQLLIECLRMDGIEPPRSFGNETIHAAFSTVSLPGILSNVANKKLLDSFQAQPIIATRLCSEGDLSDFKENQRFRLTDVGDLAPIAADGEIKEGGLSEEKATNQLDTYGKKFCLTRKMVIDDDLGAFMKVPTAMGNRAARLIDQLFFRRLLSNPNQSDNSALFAEAHKNLLSGATSVLAAEGLRLAIKLFLDQVDADGEPISIEPKFLLVPTALKHTAIELTKGATLIMAGGGDTPSIRPALNVLADENLEVVSSPYLSNPKYAGNSESAWYLFGNPSQIDTFEIGFLKGKRTPTVERGDTDFNTLGLWFRVYFDLGVREQDYRGMVRSAGQ